MKKMAGVLILLLSFVTASRAIAQQGGAAGAVMVHVTCADTGAPARFARVILQPVSDLEKGVAANQKRVEDSTDRNGDAAFQNVPAGMYLIDASLAGYIQPVHLIADQALQSQDPQIRKLVLNEVPHVTVESNTTSRAAAAMERGSAVSGRVIYDDGAPIENIAVQITRVGEVNSDAVDEKGLIYKRNSSFRSSTDDRGMYRVAGLPPGTYIASARIMTNHLRPRIFARDNVTLETTQAGDVNLTVYAPATTQRAKAQPIAVIEGEERQGVDLIADITHLHSVGGYVNRRGTVLPGAPVELDDVDDAENRHGSVADATGYFRFDLLGEAHYRLTAYPPRTLMDSGERKASASMSVPVTNADVLDLNVDLSGSAQ